MSYTKAERASALARLARTLRPGDTVHTVIRHVSRSGMSRSISCVITDKDGPADVSWAVARVLGWPVDQKNGGVKVSGCGMDMGFHIVYSLSRALWPKGFRCSGEHRRCSSSDHNNPPYPERDGRSKHSDGGYALDHRWL